MYLLLTKSQASFKLPESMRHHAPKAEFISIYLKKVKPSSLFSVGEAWRSIPGGDICGGVVIVGLALWCVMHAPFVLYWCLLLQDITGCLSDTARAKLITGAAEPCHLSIHPHAGTQAGLVALAEAAAVRSLQTRGRHRLKEPAAADWEQVPGCKQAAAAVAAGGRLVPVMVVAHRLLLLAARMRPMGVPVSKHFHLQTHQMA